MGLFAQDTVAVDIGSYSIKGVIVSSSKELKKFSVVPTPPGAIEGGIVRDPERIAATIQTLWKNLGVKQPQVVSTVPGQHVFVRLLSLPAMKKGEMDQAVRFQAEGQIPIPPTDLVFDYSLVGEQKGKKQLDVLVAATRKSVIQQMVHLFSQAKLQAKVLDLESLALARIMFKKNRKYTPGDLEMVVSIGAANTHIAMFDGEVPRFTRSIPFGGQRFTRALAVERSISLEDAEERKLNGDQPNEANSLMEDLASELERSINFFQSQNKEQFIRKVVLSGGGALMPNLIPYLVEHLETPVELGNPLDQLKVPKRLAQPANVTAMQSYLAPALGVALRGLK